MVESTTRSLGAKGEVRSSIFGAARRAFTFLFDTMEKNDIDDDNTKLSSKFQGVSSSFSRGNRLSNGLRANLGRFAGFQLFQTWKCDCSRKQECSLSKEFPYGLIILKCCISLLNFIIQSGHLFVPIFVIFKIPFQPKLSHKHTNDMHVAVGIGTGRNILQAHFISPSLSSLCLRIIENPHSRKLEISFILISQ